MVTTVTSARVVTKLTIKRLSIDTIKIATIETIATITPKQGISGNDLKTNICYIKAVTTKQ